VDIAPAGAATAELPASQPAGGGPGAGGPGDGGPAEPRPAGPGPEHEDLEPEDIVRTPEAAAGGEDQGGDDELPQEAAAPLPEPVLRPFRGHDVRGLLPVDAGLGSSRQHAKDLIAVRFLCKFLYEIGEIPVFEPFRRYRQVGDVRWRAFPGARGGSDGKAPPAAEKAHGAMGAGGPAAAGMPAAPTTPVAAAVGAGEILDRCGADALRLFFLAGGPLAAAIRPDSGALQGVRRFLDRVWRQFGTRLEKGKFVSRRVLVAKHLLIHEVTGRLARWSVHTAVASLMKFVRFLGHPETTPEEMDRNAMETFLVVLSPFAPYLAEELWRRMGKEGPLREAAWPVASDELVHPPEREFPIFLEGKVRDRMLQPTNLEAEKLESRALGRERIRELIGTRKVAKVVVVPGRLVSIALEGQPAVPAGSSS
jgi:leucyl-tRNA synthetase